MADRDTSRWLVAVDAGLVLAVFGVPFTFGGRHAFGESLLILSAVWSSMAWAMFQVTRRHPFWIRTRVEPVLLAFLSVGVLQVISLPSMLTTCLSPAAERLLPAWFSKSAQGLFPGPWPYLSLSVSETVPRIAIGIAYVLLFHVTCQRVRKLEDAGRVLKWIASAGAAMALFGFVQFFFSNGLYYGVFDLPQVRMDDRLKGAFLNKNHFSQFVALSIGPLIWWLVVHTESGSQRGRSFGQTSGRKQLRPVMTGCLSAAVGLVITAVLVSRARGAFVAVAVSLLVLMLILYARSLISRRQLSIAAGAAGVVLLLLGILGHRELGRVAERLENWDNNGRFLIWQANVEVIKEFPLTGTGIGSHLQIHRRHLDSPFSTSQYTHAESGYLQIATETGLIGLAVAGVCLGLCFFWCVRGIRISGDRRATLMLSAGFCSLMISCLQSLVDFVWYVPGCVVPILLQMACACRVYQLERDRLQAPAASREIPLPRPVFVTVVLLLLPVGGWMVSQWLPRLQAEPHWANYRKVVLSRKTGKEISSNLTVPENSRWPELQQVLLDLRAAVRRNPNDSRIHTRLAVQYTRLFHLLQKNSEMGLPLDQIRDAAQNGGFESHGELQQWLGRAFGDNIRYARAAAAHAQRAIELNPIDGLAWLYLSDLSFLLDTPRDYDRACLAQSLLLRPYDPQVLYAAGQDARMNGDTEQWVEYWRKAFHRDEDIQLDIMRSIAESTRAPVEIIVEAFEPDIHAVERMESILRELKQPEHRLKAVALLADRLTARAQAEKNRDRVNDWRRAAVAYAQLDRPQRVEACFRKAIESAPSNFRIHLEFGNWLMERGRTTESFEHLKWCERIAPYNTRVRRLMTRLERRIQQDQKVRQVSGTAAERF